MSKLWLVARKELRIMARTTGYRIATVAGPFLFVALLLVPVVVERLIDQASEGQTVALVAAGPLLPAIRAELKLQHAETQLEQRRKESDVAEARLIELRDRHRNTADLVKNEARLAELRGSAAQIDAARRELEAARRAVALVPLIEEADRATREADHARHAARGAGQANRGATCVHEQRVRELEQAEQQAEEIPALRDRIADLDRILGRLPELRRLETEVAKKRTRIEQLDQEVKHGHKHSEELTEEAARKQTSVEATRAKLDTVGYDAELDDALDRVRETVTKLVIVRGKFQDAKSEGERLRTTVDGLVIEVDRFTTQVREKEAALHKAEQDGEAAEEALQRPIARTLSTIYASRWWPGLLARSAHSSWPIRRRPNFTLTSRPPSTATTTPAPRCGEFATRRRKRGIH